MVGFHGFKVCVLLCVLWHVHCLMNFASVSSLLGKIDLLTLKPMDKLKMEPLCPPYHTDTHLKIFPLKITWAYDM